MQRAARFVAVQQPRLEVTNRQITVGVWLQGVQLAMAWTVHRLDRHRAILGLRYEHVLAVLVPMARDLPQRTVIQLRGLDLRIATPAPHLATEGDQRIEYLC